MSSQENSTCVFQVFMYNLFCVVVPWLYLHSSFNLAFFFLTQWNTDKSNHLRFVVTSPACDNVNNIQSHLVLGAMWRIVNIEMVVICEQKLFQPHISLLRLRVCTYLQAYLPLCGSCCLGNRGASMWGGQHPQPGIIVVAVSYMEKAWSTIWSCLSLFMIV